MTYTRQLLDALMRRYDLKTGYQVARFLNLHRNTTYNYLNERGEMDDAVAIHVADLLDLEPGWVLVQLHAARTDCPAAADALWSIAARVAPDESAA